MYPNKLLCLTLAFLLCDAAPALDRFTKISASGLALPADATGHQCVYDDTTDLLWEVKTDDGGLRDKDWYYTWYYANSPDGNPGTSSGTTNCYQTGRCDTEKFAADVNAAGGLCGVTDGWEVPTFDQLVSIVDDTVDNPSIDSNYFPNTVSSWFWTSSPYESISCCSWIVDFNNGYVGYNYRDYYYFVRCVRVGQWLFPFSLTINKLGTGSGAVVSNPTNINCGTVCSAQFLSLKSTIPVTLTATPAAGSVFGGWSSNCANGQVTMTADTTCTATFNLITAPVVSTDAPSVVTTNSATLKGTVNPKNAVTTASFDFGTTTSYGTNIAATPNSIAATAGATSVSASKTGLYAATPYHYRVRAVNSAGTTLGTDQTFTTTAYANTTPLENGVTLSNQTIAAGEWQYFYLNVPAGADGLKFTTSGSGDLDLYAQPNALPSMDTFTCNSETGSSNETCIPSTTTAGTWWLGAFAYEDSTVSVTGFFRQPQTIGTIAFNPATVAVTGTTTASATASSGLPVTFTSATTSVCNATGSNGSVIQALHTGTCTITANQAGNSNYVAAPTKNKSITISKASQTVNLTCNSANITVGTTANCTATATSGLTPILTSTTPSVCSITDTTVTGKTVGTCNIVANQAGDSDYLAATAATASIAVAKGNQTITLTCAPLNIAVTGTATCTATASSDLPVSLTVVDPSVCSIANGTVTGLVIGLCTVKARQAGNANYNLATPVTQNINVGNVVMYNVTPTAGTGGNVSPNTVQSIIQGSTASFTVTANTGYSSNSAVTGTCPQGSWSGNIWTTGAITANCTVNFNFTLNTYQITANAGNGGTVTPTTPTVTYGATQSFTVTPNTDYTIDSAVTGTCPSGTWNGNVWTTGAITAACTVNFSFTYNPVAVNGTCGTANGGTFATAPNANLCTTGTASTVTNTNGVWNWTCNGVNGGSNTSCTANIMSYTVTVNAGNGGTVNPNAAQSVTAGATASFTVTPTNGYTTNTTVTGTCPQGSWNSNVWTTGTITTNCSVTFSFTALPANAWLSPPSPIVKRDRPFTLDVTANSNTMKIASYKFTVTLDPAKLAFDTLYQNANQTCIFGICPGTSTLTSLIVDDTDLNTGTLVLIGQDTQGGKGPGNDLQLVVAHLKTKTVLGTTPVTLITNKLNNPSGGSIGLDSRDATVTISPGLCGDADGNDLVNIVDALAVARKVVGLQPPPTVDVTLADVNVNKDGVTIADALHIARYSVGLVLVPEVCRIGQAL